MSPMLGPISCELIRWAIIEISAKYKRLALLKLTFHLLCSLRTSLILCFSIFGLLSRDFEYQQLGINVKWQIKLNLIGFKLQVNHHPMRRKKILNTTRKCSSYSNVNSGSSLSICWNSTVKLCISFSFRLYYSKFKELIQLTDIRHCIQNYEHRAYLRMNNLHTINLFSNRFYRVVIAHEHSWSICTFQTNAERSRIGRFTTKPTGS